MPAASTCLRPPGILRTADPPFMENSVLASTTDAHNNFDLAYFVSHRDDNVDTAATGGKFINVAPVRDQQRRLAGTARHGAARRPGTADGGYGKLSAKRALPGLCAPA